MISKNELLKRNETFKNKMKEFENKLDEELLKTTDITDSKVRVALWGSFPDSIVKEVLDNYVAKGNYSKYEYKESFDRCSFTSITLYF